MFQRILVAFISLLFTSPLFAADYIVKLKPGAAVPMNEMSGVKVLDQHNPGRLMKVSLDDTRELKLVNQLQDTAGVEYIVKDFKLKAFRAPLTANALREQWAIAKVNAEKAWSLAGNKGQRNITVAVIDTGVDYDHESLRPNMVQGYDFLDNDNQPMDETSSANPGHGTHCAGIVGATGLVDGGIVGISPEVSIMPLRFLGPQGNGDLMAGIRAIDHAIQNGVQVISASWGATVPRSQAQPLIEAVERADKAGIVFVAAAANDGSSNDRTSVFPANSNTANMISVAASGPNDTKPQWSNYGKWSVDLAAPGENIMSTIPRNKYMNLSGTSMATPLVSGLVALLLAQDITLTGKEVRSLIQSSAAKVNIETACDCRVDAAAAVEALQNKKMFVVPFAETLEKNETMKFSAKFAQGQLSFNSSNPSVATISADGTLTAVAEGETTVSVTDASGQSAMSHKIYVRGANSGGGGGGGGGGGECPIGDPQLCQIICELQPDLPFCQ
ncbi:MAG: S8 family serine peptidase [Bdellovibrionales bacterium]|nr:S8 family serine peptidase [Bdellovibrionales bacterium]